MRIESTRAFLLSTLLVAASACRSPASVAEMGAALVRIVSATDAPRPDELRAWVYDDQGTIWDGARIPDSGSLPAMGGPELGSVLIQPGAVHGPLRIDVRGFVAGARVSEGVVAIPIGGREKTTFEVDLGVASLDDTDGDGVPDAIDDCPGTANPAQGGCPSPDVDAAADVSGSGGKSVGSGGGGGDSDGSGGEAVTATGGAPGSGGAAGTGNDGGVTSDADAGGAGGTAGGTGGTAGAMSDGGEAGAPACAFDGGCGRSLGAACAGDGQCESGICADGVCCDSACVGPCRSCNQPSTNGTCTGYVAGSDPETECGGGTTCNGAGACGTPPPRNKTNGQACLAANECVSGFCTDGACCNKACGNPCESCRTGTCTPVMKMTDIPECSGTMTCNAHGNCVTAGN